MTISLIAAVAENGVIGTGRGLPWHLPPDMKHFQQMTMGKPVVMGRRTFETLDQPLPGRKNIIITRQTDYHCDDCVVAHSLKEALQAAADTEEVMIAGGAAIYQATLPLADRMYLTLIHETFDGTVFFPEFDRTEWREIDREDYYDSDQPYDYSFITYERIEK